MSDIQVHYDSLNTAAQDIRNAAGRIKRELDDLEREVRRVASTWEGEAKEAYQKASREEQEKMMAAEVKANLLTAWREDVEKSPKLKELENLQRGAQWRLDLVAAENSMGFHAPQEMARILGESIDLSRQAQVLAGTMGPVAMATPAVVPASAPAKK